jgi:membrane protein implicated in regulation of membrane protease activity
MDPWTTAFVVVGSVLLVSELVAPSLAAVFFGLGAFATAAARALGLIEGLPVSLLVWAASSLALFVPFRPLMQRLASGKTVVKRDTTDVEHDREAMGEVVEVVEDVSDDDDNGRIRFQGTTWQARATTGRFKRGERVQLVYRAESLWVVEAIAGAMNHGGARDAFGTATAEARAEVEEAAGAPAAAPRRR